MTNELILKEVKMNGREVQQFNLACYEHVWLDACRVAVCMAKGWEVFEVVKWESDQVLLVRHMESFSDLNLFVR